jgi:hypothetical protein
VHLRSAATDFDEVKTITTHDTQEALAAIEQAKRDGHHVRTLARGKTNAEFTITIDTGPAQPDLALVGEGVGVDLACHPPYTPKIKISSKPQGWCPKEG